MHLFGFGPAGGPSPVPLGSVFSYVFDWAGNYAYNDPFHTSVKGTVQVPTRVSLLPGTTSTAAVTRAAADAPSGFVFDIQARQPGSSTWRSWRTGQSMLQGALGPGDALYVGPGTYAFRARLRDTLNGAPSGYSQAAAIPLSGARVDSIQVFEAHLAAVSGVDPPSLSARLQHPLRDLTVSVSESIPAVNVFPPHCSGGQPSSAAREHPALVIGEERSRRGLGHLVSVDKRGKFGGCSRR
jgi:hypothetical protein